MFQGGYDEKIEKKNNPCNIFMLKIQKDEKSGSIDPVFLV